MDAVAQATSASAKRIRCSACRCEPGSTVDQHGRSVCFEDEDKLLAHIAVQHVRWIPFECILCPVMCSTDTVLQLHYEQAHQGILPKAIYTHEGGKKKQMLDILAQSKSESENSSPPSQSTSTKSNASICDMRLSPFPTSAENNGHVSELHIPLPLTREQSEEVVGDSHSTIGRESPIEEVVSLNPKESYITEHSAGENASSPHAGCTTNTALQTQTRPATYPSTDCRMLSESPLIELDDETYARPLPNQQPTNDQQLLYDGYQFKHETLDDFALDTDNTGAVEYLSNTQETDDVQSDATAAVMPLLSPTSAQASVRTLQDTIEEAQDFPQPPSATVKKHKRLAVQAAAAGGSKSRRRSSRSSIASIEYFPPEEDNVSEDSDKNDAADHRDEVVDKRSYAPQMCNVCNELITRGNRCGHVWRHHMKEIRYHCKLCDFKTSCNGNRLLHRHQSWTDNKPRLLPEYKVAWTASFGNYNRTGPYRLLDDTALQARANDNDGSAPKGHLVPPTPPGMQEQVRCRLCDLLLVFANKGTHVWRMHIKEERFRCGACSYGTHKISNMRTHARQAQHDGPPCWTDHTQEIIGEYRETFSRAFGDEVTRRWPRIMKKPTVTEKI